MFGQLYYHSLIRKYVIGFGTLFDDIYIDRTDSQGTTTQRIKVTLTYGPKDKMLYRVLNDPEFIKQASIILPMMSFELKSINYDSTRHKNTLNQTVRLNTDPNKMSYVYQSVPYDLNFELYIYTLNAEDGTKIVEKILPNFKPNWDMTLSLIPELNYKLDTPVIIGQPSSEDKYDGTFTNRRSIVWTIPFTLKGEMIGPVKAKKIIKFAKEEFYFDPSLDPQSKVGYVNVQPGLTANGTPTTNANNSVDPNTIYANNDFGFVVESSGIILNE